MPLTSTPIVRNLKPTPTLTESRDTIVIHAERTADVSMNCPVCKRSLSRLDHLKSHVKRVHGKMLIIKRSTQVTSSSQDSTAAQRTCTICNRKFRHVDQLRRHMRFIHKTKMTKSSSSTFQRKSRKYNYAIEDRMENDCFLLVRVDGDDADADSPSANDVTNKNLNSLKTSIFFCNAQWAVIR